MDEPTAEPRPAELTPEQKEKLDILARDAAIARRRGDRDTLNKVLEEAKELAPDSPLVLEFVGDELLGRKKYKEAAEVFRKAHELDPLNKGLEIKHADAAYAVAMGELPMELRSDFENVASAKSAAILSALVPGLGQIVSGQRNLGIGLFTGWALGWIFTLMIPNGLKGLLHLMGLGRDKVDFNPLVLLTLFFAALFHFWSYLDAASKSKVAAPKRVDRPIPPSDKDFI